MIENIQLLYIQNNLICKIIDRTHNNSVDKSRESCLHAYSGFSIGTRLPQSIYYNDIQIFDKMLIYHRNCDAPTLEDGIF